MLAHDAHPGRTPTLVLLHGWTGDRTAMDPVAEAFCAHAQIRLDLLGHGASPRADDYSIAAQARAVLDIVPAGSIIIGHSMGAQVAIECAVQAPDKIRAVVLLDPAQIIPIEKSRLFGLALQQRLRGANPRDVLAAFAAEGAVKVADPERYQRNIERMCATDPDVIVRAWDAIISWPGAARLGALPCPALVIAIDKPINKLVDLAKANARIMTAQVAGSGHSLQFEVMPQVAAMMNRFFDLRNLNL